jgi:hypothetical protein
LGCGDKAHLVRALRKKGVDAEGIDPYAPKGREFMKQKVFGVYPSSGGIPREDDSYTWAFAHSFKPFYLGLAKDCGEDREKKDLEMEASFAFWEVLRVLKSGGKMIVHPAIEDATKICYVIGGPKYSLEHVPFDSKDQRPKATFESSMLMERGYSLEELFFIYNHRTIITKD